MFSYHKTAKKDTDNPRLHQVMACSYRLSFKQACTPEKKRKEKVEVIELWQVNFYISAVFVASSSQSSFL